MERFVGIKHVTAKPMNRKEYNDYRGWELPDDEDGSDAGFLKDDGQGHIQWDPADVFNRDFRPVESMSIGLALEAMRSGHKVARRGWNGKDMWIVLMSAMELPPFSTQGTARKVNDRTAKWIGEGTPLVTLPYIAMWTADKKWLPGWLASQSDLLADDWVII